MVKRNALVVSAAALAVLALVFFPTDTRRIKKLLKRTAEWSSKAPEEQPVVAAARSRKAGEFFAGKVLFELAARDVRRELDIEDIQRGYVFLMQSRRSFEVGLEDVRVDVGGGGTASAVATVLVETDGPDPGGILGVNEVEFGLVEGDEGWRISSVRLAEVLDK